MVYVFGVRVATGVFGSYALIIITFAHSHTRIQVLFLFLTSIFTLGFWLSLSRVLADELPCRASSGTYVCRVCMIVDVQYDSVYLLREQWCV